MSPRLVRPRLMRPRPVFALALALALLAGLPSGAAAVELKVRDLAFLPARFGPGEAAEAFLLVEPEGGEPEAFEAKVGQGLGVQAADADPELRAVSLRKGRDGWELRLSFVAWSPGKGRIAAREVRGVTLPAVDYEATSALLPGDREARPPKAQLDPPGTALYLYGFLGLLVVLGLLAFGAVAWLLPAGRRLLAARRAGEARRALAKSLDWLGRELAGRSGRPVDPAAFHAVLSRSLRIYLAARVLPEAHALTPAELSLLGDDRFPDPGVRDEAAALLSESDNVRFAGRPADLPSLRAALDRASRLGDLSEEALDAHA